MVLFEVFAGVVLAAVAAVEFEAQTLDGQPVVGELARLDAQALVLNTPSGEQTLPRAKLATVSRRGAAPVDSAKVTVAVELLDDSLLAATEYLVTGGTAKVTLVGGTVVDVPTKIIRWVRFGRAAGRDAKVDQQWAEIAEVKASGDVLVVRKNGVLDYLEGVQQDIDATTCKFKLDDDVIPVKRAKVEGIRYAHAKPLELPDAAASVSDQGGSRWAMASANVAGESFELVTATGLKMNLPLESVVRLDFSSGNVAYLSDLEPESFKYVPFLGWKNEPEGLQAYYHFRRDVGFEQQPLRLDGKTYAKGLALQSRTVLSYKLPGKFRQFRAIAGIDDGVRETGGVQVEIRGDGKMIWEGKILGLEGARDLELDIEGVRRLEITVDYGPGTDVGDRLDLCEARVTK